MAFRIFLLVSLAAIGDRLFGQQLSKVTGIVQDELGRGIASATISLLNGKDSSLHKIDLADNNGSFLIEGVFSGHFILVYSATGYTTLHSGGFVIEAGQVFKAPVVSLKPLPGILKEVEVKGRKQLVQLKPGMTIVNVAASINATGSNVFEILGRSPGITIDHNGRLSMRGKTGVQVYVDNRLLKFNQEELAAYLRSIPASDIEHIELVTTPGVEFDAGGTSGVINIRLRKNMSYGTNAGISAGLVMGVTLKGNASLNLNSRSRKLNFYSNFSMNKGRYKTDIWAPRVQKDTLYDQRLVHLSDNNSYNFKGGVDYFITGRHTIGVMNTTGYNVEDWHSHGITGIFTNTTGTFVKSLEALNVIPKKRFTSNSNLNYRYTDTVGSFVNIDIDYGLYNGRANSYQPNIYIDKDKQVISRVITHNNTPTDIGIFTARVDVSVKKWKGRLDFGGKFSSVKTGNTLDFYNEANNRKEWDATRSYLFDYRENVSAAYLSFDRQYSSKWNGRLGLRVEQTESKGVLQRGDGVEQQGNSVKRSMLDLFPNIMISHSPGLNTTIRLSYARRLDRPNYQELNPFEFKNDELTYVKGNAFLNPQYSHNIELEYARNKKFTSSLSFSNTQDLVVQTVDTFRNFTFAFPKNIAMQNTVSFNLNAPVSLTRWWNGFFNARVNYQVFKGKINGNKVYLDYISVGGFTQHSFEFLSEYSAELTGWVNGPTVLGPTVKAKTMGAIDIGLQKLVFRRNGSIRVTVTDIFKTSVPFRGVTDFAGLLLKFRVSGESQTAKITFSYRFGNNKVAGARQRQPGLETETKRIKEN